MNKFLKLNLKLTKGSTAGGAGGGVGSLTRIGRGGGGEGGGEGWGSENISSVSWAAISSTDSSSKLLNSSSLSNV